MKAIEDILAKTTEAYTDGDLARLRGFVEYACDDRPHLIALALRCLDALSHYDDPRDLLDELHQLRDLDAKKVHREWQKGKDNWSKEWRRIAEAAVLNDPDGSEAEDA